MLTAYSKEKEPLVAKNILRALGTTGAGNSRALKLVIREAHSSKDDLLRANAIVALGSLTSDAKASATLVTALESENVETRKAALCAAALSRDPVWLEILEQMAEAEPAVQGVCSTAIRVLTKGDLKPIQDPLTRVARDEIPRERLFGPARAGRGN